MALEPFISKTRLINASKRKGLIVVSEDDKIVIQNGSIELTLTMDALITDGDGKAYSNKEAFTALGLSL